MPGNDSTLRQWYHGRNSIPATSLDLSTVLGLSGELTGLVTACGLALYTLLHNIQLLGDQFSGDQLLTWSTPTRSILLLGNRFLWSQVWWTELLKYCACSLITIVHWLSSIHFLCTHYKKAIGLCKSLPLLYDCLESKVLVVELVLSVVVRPSLDWGIPHQGTMYMLHICVPT